MTIRKAKTILLTVILLTACILCGAIAPSAKAATTNSYNVSVYFNTGGGSLALRNSPGNNGGTIMNIPFGTNLQITQVQSGWGQVNYNGVTGWVPLHDTKVEGDYPTPQPSSGQINPVYYTVYNTEGEGLELRTSPTTDASTFGPLYDGTVIKAEARSGEWVYGKSSGHYGWCNTTYLRSSNDSEISAYDAQEAQAQASQTVQGGQTGSQGTMTTLPADNGYMRAYTDTLNSYRDAIMLYDWQFGDGSAKPVALCDITGDGIPELIFICAAEGEGGMHTAQLHIVTFADGVSRELYAGNLGKPKEAGGYFYYYLFLMTDKPSLYYYTDEGDDGGSTSYGRFDIAADGTMFMTNLFVDKDLGSGSAGQHEYYQKETAISQEEYLQQIQKAQSVTNAIVIYSSGCGEFAENFVAQNGCMAMTLEEALNLLNGMTGGGTDSGMTGAPTADAAVISTSDESDILSQVEGTWYSVDPGNGERSGNATAIFHDHGYLEYVGDSFICEPTSDYGDYFKIIAYKISGSGGSDTLVFGYDPAYPTHLSVNTPQGALARAANGMMER